MVLGWFSVGCSLKNNAMAPIDMAATTIIGISFFVSDNLLPSLLFYY
jgi:hypothetical protein